MCDHQVPAVVEYAENVALDVIAGTLRREQVATPSVVAAPREGVTHNATELASNQNSHVSTSM
jgi:hypothetical protein